MPCSVRGCNGTWALKTLPAANSDSKRRAKWMQYCSKRNLELKVPRICMNHFSDDQVVVIDEKRYLKYNAVPDINLPSSDGEEPTPTSRKRPCPTPAAKQKRLVDVSDSTKPTPPPPQPRRPEPPAEPAPAEVSEDQEPTSAAPETSCPIPADEWDLRVEVVDNDEWTGGLPETRPDPPDEQEPHGQIHPGENESVVPGQAFSHENPSRTETHQGSEIVVQFANDHNQQRNRKDNVLKKKGKPKAPQRGTDKRGKWHVCKDCGKTFAHPDYLSRHRLVHTGRPMFKCDICGEEKFSSYSLDRHKRHHTSKNIRVCRSCDLEFSSRAAHAQHMLSEHGEKAFTCEVCSAQFMYRSHLTDHMRTHAKDRPFACSYCDSSFRLRTTLYQHTVVNHTYDFKRWCNLCGKGFLANRELERHIAKCMRST